MAYPSDILASAQALLEPKAHPKLPELLRAIKEVNPTARGLSPSDQARRYLIKSQLQSALIRLYGEELEVILEHEDLVLLRVRFSGRDACHARLSALDEEAQRWVRWHLDVPPVESVRTTDLDLTPTDGSDAPVDWVAKGRRALARYDFDKARSFFEQAASAADPTPGAEALLELLVDHLADDAEALRVLASLPHDVRKSDRVRLLHAVSLIRTQPALEAARQKAWDLLGTNEDPRTPDVLLDLAQAALDAGALDEASRVLSCCKSGPKDRWDALQQNIAALRAGSRAPLEAALQASLDSKPEAEVEAEARGLLARWPESRVARQVLEQVLVRRAARLVKESLLLAQQCEQKGNWDGAMTALRAALVHLPDGQKGPVAARLEALERQVSELRLQKRVSEVLAALPQESGLLAYLTLSLEAAQRVRSQSQLPVLAQLEELRPLLESRPPAELVQAALAWTEAKTMAQHDVHGALNKLLSQGPVLSQVPAASALMRQVKASAVQAAREQCQKALVQARAALDQMDWEGALGTLEPVRARGAHLLEPGLQAELSAVHRTAVSLRSDMQLFMSYERDELYPTARGLAQRCADTTKDPAFKAGWQERVQRMRQLANGAFQLERSTERHPAKFDRLSAALGKNTTGCWLEPHKDLIFFCRGIATHFMGSVVDAAQKDETCVFLMRMPWGSVMQSCEATDDGVWLLFPEAALKVNEVGEPVDLLMLRESDATDPLRIVEQALISDDCHYLWMNYADGVEVMRLRQGHGQMVSLQEPMRILAARGTGLVVCALRKGQKVEVRRGDFSLVTSISAPYRWEVLDAAAHPSQEALVLLSRAQIPEPSTSGLSLHVVDLKTGARHETRLPLQLPTDSQRVAFASGKKTGRVYLTYEKGESAELIAYRPEQNRFQPHYARSLPANPVLLGDRLGQRVYVYGHSDEPGPVFEELGAEQAPEKPLQGQSSAQGLGDLSE